MKRLRFKVKKRKHEYVIKQRKKFLCFNYWKSYKKRFFSKTDACNYVQVILRKYNIKNKTHEQKQFNSIWGRRSSS